MKKLISLVLLLGGHAGAGYIPDMPYFHQYSNRLNPSVSCQNTCIVIVLIYYGADDITPEKIAVIGTGFYFAMNWDMRAIKVCIDGQM